MMATEITAQNMDRVLAFLPLFESRNHKLYTVRSKPPSMDPYVYSDDIDRFVSALYSEGFVVRFDWPAWCETAQRFVDDPGLLDSADLSTLQRLLTTHVRQDRFCSGHLAQMMDNGQILAILNRLAAIRAAKTTIQEDPG